MKFYFLFDCETGGLDENKHSLLTLYGLLLNQKLEILDEIDLSIKPDDGIYHVTAQAMRINKINFVEHDKNAIKYSEASKILEKKLINWTSFNKNQVSTKLIPVGHNVGMDLRFGKKLLSSLEEYLSHRPLDTSTNCQFLQLKHKLPLDKEFTLGELAEFLGIDSSGAHNAKIDVHMTLKVLKKQLSL